MSRQIVRRGVAENALALYATQFAGYIFPLLLIPYIARTLHPEALGQVAVAQSFAAWSAMLLDFGFTLSASREVARYQEDWEQVSHVFSSVFAAKGMLAILVICSAIVAQIAVPIFRQSPSLIWAAVFIALMQGSNVGWFFLGLGRMRSITMFDLAAKACSLGGVLLTVRGPHDAWKVLLFQGIGVAIPSAAGIYIVVSRHINLRTPTRERIWSTLVQSWPIFLINSIITFYGTANMMILGMVQTPRIVGIYAGSDKSVRPFYNLFAPISQALYSHTSSLVVRQPRLAGKTAFQSLRIMIAAGLVLALAVALGAPLLVHLLLGRDYDAAIPVVRLLSLVIPFSAAGFCIGQQCMLPLGLEKVFMRVVTVSTVVDLTLALTLVRRYGANGMVIAILSGEAVTVIGNYLYLTRKRLAPHQWRLRPEIGSVVIS
jgi:PST family polysaccharide transporter